MTSYLISYKGAFKDVLVRTYPGPERAKAMFDSPSFSTDPAVSGFVVSEENDIDLTGPGLVGLYNGLTGESISKFESRTVGRRRVWEAIREKYQHQPPDQGQAAPVEGSLNAATDGEDDMAKKATKKKAAKKTKAPAGERKPRGVGKPAGKVADLRQVRDGTDRAKVLKLMTGKNTAAQIGQELGIDEKKVGTIIFCLSRDCGIGYSFGEKGQVEAIYPGDKTYKDVIKKAAE